MDEIRYHQHVYACILHIVSVQENANTSPCYRYTCCAYAHPHKNEEEYKYTTSDHTRCSPYLFTHIPLCAHACSMLVLLSEKDPVMVQVGVVGGSHATALHTIYISHLQPYLTPNTLHLLSGLHILEESAMWK